MEAIILPRVLDTRKGDNVRRTYRIANCKKYWIKSRYDNKIDVELGTGIHAENGNGRRTPWIWEDENGKRHKTSGMKPRHFMKKAIADHIDEYKEILETSLKS
jgi:hypothetical protein